VKYPKRSQYKCAKSRYRVRNWFEYEAGLQKRGDLTVWLSDTALDAWRAPASGKPGGQRRYADIAIEAALTIRMVFHLPLRQTEGFLRCLANPLEVDLPIPDHTTLSRRLKKLGEIQSRRLPTDQPIHLLIDSTGLRIHVGHLRKPPNKRAWRKLHLAVDARTGEIVASELTDRRTHDCTRVGPLLEQIDNPLASLSADGAYDAVGVYEVAQSKGEGRTREDAHPTWTRCPAGSRTVAGSEGKEPQHPLHPNTRTAGVAHTMTSLGMPDSHRAS
jgi:hypothetical protein